MIILIDDLLLLDFYFKLDLEQLQDDPISILQTLHEGLKANHSFPLIRYKGSEGIDAGGLSRDFVTRLFNRIFDKNAPCLPVYALGEYFLPEWKARLNRKKRMVHN